MKTIEKQKEARVERLKNLLAQEKKDDGLVFDELGVDHIFIDEAQYYKNLETPTKMERVAGIQTGGSERAFDVYMKARYLHEQHPGHGVTFATGTPISNTMVEMYTLCSQAHNVYYVAQPLMWPADFQSVTHRLFHSASQHNRRLIPIESGGCLLATNEAEPCLNDSSRVHLCWLVSRMGRWPRTAAGILPTAPSGRCRAGPCEASPATR
jgi:hypothetical protein